MTLIRLILCVIFIVLVAGASLWVSNHPGELELQWLGYHIETSFWVLLSAILLTVITCCFIFWAIMKLFYHARSFKKQRALKHHDRAYNSFADIIVALSLHQYDQAETLLKKTQTHIGENSLTALLHAHLASKQGNEVQKLEAFEKLSDYDQTNYLAARALTRQHIMQHNNAAAMEEAKRAYKLRPDVKDSVTAYLDQLLLASEYNEAQSVVIVAARQKVLLKQEKQHYLALIDFVRYERSEIPNKQYLKKAFDTSPSFIPSYGYISLLHSDGSLRGAFKALKKAWKAAPHAILSDIFVEHFAKDSDKAIQRAELLLQIHPEHIESHILMGRTAMMNQQWSIARNHLKAALEIEPQMRIFRLLASLEREELHDNEKANAWLERLKHAKPDPSWQCRMCGHHTSEWNMHCLSCSSFDSYDWHNMQYATSENATMPASTAPLDFLET